MIAPKPAHRERALSDAELAAVWRAAGELSPKSRVFARLLVLTGARVSEVASIAWGELDLPAGRWTISGERAKNGNPITLPLAPAALTELQAVLPPDGARSGFRLLGAIQRAAALAVEGQAAARHAQRGERLDTP